VTMSLTRRFLLLEWARRAGAWIIEDDYDSEYRYDSKPLTSLQGLDTKDRVIYTGSLSKVLFPSLRLGYIVIPMDLVERFVAVRQAMDICPNHSIQAVMAAFIREGHFARHLKRMRKLYHERREVLVHELEQQFGSSCEIVGAEAGMHLTLLLGDKLQDQEAAKKAVQQRIHLSALSLSHVGSVVRPGFVLGFGNTPTSQIAHAVRVLKKIVTE
jgi:GntR family transcriptional regulator/MocR family aminotransferase